MALSEGIKDIVKDFVELLEDINSGFHRWVTVDHVKLIIISIVKFFMFMICLTGSFSLIKNIFYKIYPKSSEELIAESARFLKKDRLAKAEAVLKLCITNYPRYYDGYKNLAELQLQNGRYRECIDTAKSGLLVNQTWKGLSNICLEAEGLMSGRVSKEQLLAGMHTRYL